MRRTPGREHPRGLAAETAGTVESRAGIHAAQRKKKVVNKILLLLVGAMIVLASSLRAQEVMITDFPLGVGGDVGDDFFAPYHSELSAVADTLAKYPLARAVIVGGADGNRYTTDNDAKNPGLSLGRAHALRNLLVNEFRIDSTQLLIQSVDVADQGGRFRFASVRIVWELMQMDARLDTLSSKPVQVQESSPRDMTQYLADHLGLRFSAGAASTPFGGLPMVAAAVTWKKIVFVEAAFGHTFWNRSFIFERTDLDTWRRMSAARVTIYPWDDTPVGLVGGWMRAEEISQTYYKYVQLSEGPFVGAEVTPWEHLGIMAAYNPARHRIAGQEFSNAKNGQFLISLTLHLDLGGDR